MVRRKAQEWPPSLTAGEEGTLVNMVSVAVEVNEDVGKGVARLVKGVYVADVGVGTDGATPLDPVKGENGALAVAGGGSTGEPGASKGSDTQQGDKAEQPPLAWEHEITHRFQKAGKVVMFFLPAYIKGPGGTWMRKVEAPLNYHSLKHPLFDIFSACDFL
ncbi:hypothetical protein NDU88_007751 [Pleurodeles waltl]|uniref:Uncharacterized protein n=1 Tax=Pleurodeles waltl TaxID=8319 RepID=A0AAV7PUU2_PLEWA|nr:hypothetical protein NDU88_007751 [Pleurodeles waltl]